MAALSTAAHTQTKAPESDALKGHDTFIAYGCSQCHGTVAQGGGGAPAIPKGLPVQALLAKLRHQSGRMPPYPASALSDEDVKHIAAYLAALPPDPPADTIEALKP